MARVHTLLPLAFAGALLPACTAEPAIATFERFYRASVDRDVAALRQSLCPAERRILADVDDATVLRELAVVKVLRSTRVESKSDAAAVVTATDALGEEIRVQLRSDLTSPSGFCVAGPVAQVAP